MDSQSAGKIIPACVEIAIVCSLAAIIGLAARQAPGEAKRAWQAGTILEVKTHEAAPENDAGLKQYDISVKVGKKIYVVLYSPKQDLPEPEYYVGMARTVLVEGDTLKFNDLQGNIHSMRILSSKDAPPSKSQ